MKDLDPTASLLKATYGCPECSRCFVALGTAGDLDLPCVCGAALVARSPRPGIYELRAIEPGDPLGAEPEQGSSAPGIPQEPDLGYGESHGYGPAHGGPTGPGDMPADTHDP